LVFERKAEASVVCQRKERDLRDFAVEPAQVDIYQKIEARAQDIGKKGQRLSQVIGRNDSMIDSDNLRLIITHG
jgi:hypothetical protein